LKALAHTGKLKISGPITKLERTKQIGGNSLKLILLDKPVKVRVCKVFV
jgi:hypothetical protein